MTPRIALTATLLGFVLVSFGTQALSNTFQGIARLQLWAGRVTGVVFIAVGVYDSLTYTFEVFS